MQDNNVLVTDRRFEQTATFWRECLSLVTGVYRISPHASNASGASGTQQGGLLSRTVSLTPASLEVLRSIADGELAEFAITAAAVALLLWKYFRIPVTVLGTPGLGEHAPAAATTVPLIIEVRPDERIEDYLSRVAGIVEDSYAEPHFPLATLVRNEKDMDLTQLTKVSLADERVHDALTRQDDDLQLHLRLAHGEIEIRYSGTIEPVLLDGFAGSLDTVLHGFEHLQKTVDEIDSTPPEEQRTLAAFNETATPGPSHPTVVAMFEAQVARTPSAPALVTDSSLMTYADLNAKANSLAHQLRSNYGVGPESLIGIMLDRSELMIVAILGVLKAGAAFVPLDPAYPAERINHILSDTGLSLLVTQSGQLTQWYEFSGITLLLDQELPRWKPLPANPSYTALPEQLAYVIYTSGSTGRPKGCLLEHRNLAHYISWATQYYFPDGASGSFGLYSSLCFDFTLTNVFCPLVRGKTLRIYPQSDSIDTILSRAFQPGSGVDTLKLTPTHIHLLEYMNLARSGVRKVIVGGEELTSQHIAILRKIDPAIEIYNEYGPTEATVGCIVKLVDDEASSVLIGRPIANTRVYILDEALKPVPIGVAGEICVAGHGLARGYHNRPDVTAAKFVENPFAGEQRIYRTGDIGRWLPDGQIQCYGRIDDQVKIRGHRVEPGEIEAAIATHTDVVGAAVMLRETAHGVRKLAAYVKGTPDLSVADLRTFLAGKLPDYMVPSDFFLIAEFPLNANGKLDRRALLAIEPTAAADAADTLDLDATPIQLELVRIWREVLDNPAIDLTGRFFDYGGDSLQAMQLVSRIWSSFSVEIGIDAIFELQTVSAVSDLIEASSPLSGSMAGNIQPSSRTDDLPLSFPQQRLWFLAQLEGPSAAYNISSALRFEGALDVQRLQAAVSEISRRHEILRTTFPAIDGRGVQRIAAPAPVTLAVVDIASESDSLTLLAEETDRPFDLATGPLYRAVLYRVREDLHIFGVVMHHIISDAWSSGILIGELAALYDGQSLPDLAVQYADYAVWQHERLASADTHQELALLSASLADAPDLIELPTDRPRPAIQSFRGSVLPFQLEGALADRLRSIAHASGTSTYMVVLAAYSLLLSRYSNQQDIVVGSPIANRRSSMTEPLIGFFANTLALRVDLSGNPTFDELLARVKRVALDGYSRQEIPFEQVVESLKLERNLGRTPIFQVMFAYEKVPANGPTFPGLSVTPVSVETFTAKFDLTLYMQDSDSGLAGALEYNTDLFDAATIERMAQHFRNLLDAVVEGSNQPLNGLSLLSDAERDVLTVEWNSTGTDFGADAEQPLHRLFEQQVERTPEAIAAVYEGASLTYAELNVRANRLAHRLIELGVVPDALVGVSMERSLDMIVALLAVLKAGGAYVPVDPDYPADRVRFMIDNAQLRWLLTQQHLLPVLPEIEAQLIVVDRDAAEIAAAKATNPAPALTSDNLAYMIYTSGSTGRPKGALNAHRAVTNRILWIQHAHAIGAGDSVLQKTPFSFDVSVWEFFWPLAAGARLVFARPGGQREADYLIDLIEREQITTAHFVPSMLRAFLDHPDVERCTSLRRVVCSGEALPFDLQQRFFERLDARLFNLYGPTEAAVEVSVWECRRDDPQGIVPIGKPIANARLYIVDAQMQPVPVGIAGELMIGGVPVGRGYYGDPELSAAKFIADPFSSNPQDRLYRTGDLSRFRPDGNIEFLGRIDHQIKLRGFRIELGEIEGTLRKHPAVGDCVVIAKIDGPRTSLIAYVATSLSDTSGLRGYLREHLPSYMVPSTFVALESLPLLPNGKINRKALPVPAEIVDDTHTDAPAVTPREVLLSSIWKDVLQLSSIGIHDNFFELGGDSILSIQVVSRANQAGLRITAKQLFQYQTIAELAGARDERSAYASTVDPLGDAPLTPVQHWFFDQDVDTPSHFNQTVLIQVPADIDESRLADAIQQVYEHHDALRLRFSRSTGYWTQTVVGGGDKPALFAKQAITADAADDRIAAMRAAAADAERGIDIERGPLLAARLFSFTDEPLARLFVSIHHLAVDGVSWRVLLEDLHAAYHGQPLSEKTTSFREWALHLQQLAQSPAIGNEAGLWQEILSQKIEPMPVDYPAARAANYVGNTATVSFELDEAETTALLRRLPQAYDTRINDVLLAALAQACSMVTGNSRTQIDLESHGRHVSDAPIDLTRTVGWFTSIYPVVLEIAAVQTPEEALRAARQQLRRIPNEGLGYSLLRYLSPDDAVRDSFAQLPGADILFNYHGQLDTVLQRSDGWNPATEDLGSLRSDKSLRTHLFEIVASVSNGKLQVDWIYGERIHRRQTVQNLAAHFKDRLLDFVASVPDTVAAGWDNVEDSYALSSLQQGLLFHTLYDLDPAAYFQQFSFSVSGALQVAALKQAWTNALERHAILRTAFVWADRDQPVQTVLRNVELTWESHDWRSRNASRRDDDFDAFLAEDRRRGFDLQQAPLFRCTLIQETEQRHRFCWSGHHIILDGWSTATLMKEVFEDYVSLARTGVPAVAASAPGYRRYIDWLSRHPRSADESWWRNELAGFRAATPILVDANAGKQAAGDAPRQDKRREQHFLLDEALTTRLQALMRSNRLTLNVLMRAVWALVLRRYSKTDDVVFGVTVSGRPATLDGVESIVGLFINTLPFRVRIAPQRPFTEWLATVHTAQTEMEPHSYSSLVDIQKWSELPARDSLFDSLLVFENFPVAAAPDLGPDEIEIHDTRAFAESNYPLTLTVHPDTRLAFRISHDANRFAPDVVRQMLDYIRGLLERFAEDPVQLTGSLADALVSDDGGRNDSDSRSDSRSSSKPDSSTATGEPGAQPDTAVASTTARGVAPTPDESTLLKIWQMVFERKDIKLTDNYFDLGGHSITAIRLMANVEKAFDRRLPISYLFENPTIEKLAAALGKKDSSATSGGLVPIRDGGPAAPLFLLPGAGGNVIYFRPLANSLVDTHAVYGLEALGLDGSCLPLTKVEDIAARHIERIWPLVGAGPYYLAGHSFGAQVALEMSRQLVAKGATVKLLAIFDASAPVVTTGETYWHNWDDTEWLVAIAHEISTFLGTDLQVTRADLVDLDPDSQAGLILERIGDRGNWFADTGSDRLRAYLRVYQANFKSDYAPAAEPLPVPITLFRSTERDPGDFDPSPEVAQLHLDPTWGWSGFSTLPVEVVDVPGDHLTMLLDPHASVLATHVNQSLEKNRQ
ncbi:non-ribosomal peptide synthetase [Paraburkholderia megapolitana]|uniref:Non-ribosomal peptide synthase domain TIGR01720/amino acid adenylation domain-containing protein n=1 Tax=Paraburkholderia megapolitana TaxID=420953 RepID=A0A1I3RNT3_9BURK|nr:non-ribosomal peptide synthetase [Paraburkholderia megapolitana]QDQ83931.1 non-ribosomal peptide synthetase [Paraburkholderia megapolitana]SFJ46941.1 non-ribosomal peptide synthase domain TIGR01720/amino acid adenylation domain-containing protein [Paraburkholderia megapolitana]